MATYDLTQNIPTKIAEGDILNCPYSGTYKTITLPKGTYKFECWGAQGGGIKNTSYWTGGKGGYSKGIVSLNTQYDVHLYAGGMPTTYNTGGFNGGGNCLSGSSSYSNPGGGASDIRIGSTSLYARIIVAGGGGGAANGGSSSDYSGRGGVGGGTTGGAGVSNNYSAGALGQGGTQTAGGTYGYWSGFSSGGVAGSFGQGGSPTASYFEAGGGGGWYGGGSGNYCSAGGGSSYVYTSSTASNYPSGCLLDSTMYLTDASTIAGNTSMPSTSGSTETGHEGNGYIRITVISPGASGEWVEEESYTFTYTGSVQTRTLSKGIYRIECWGALGGNATYSSYTGTGGKGGYSVGNLIVDTDIQLYIMVGGQGTFNSSSNAASTGGFNGGGTGYNYSTSLTAAGGGGASDIRIGQNSLYARVIVAGGGGGSGVYSSTAGTGGYGGGISGGTGSVVYSIYGVGTGGTQTSAGTCNGSGNYNGYASFGVGASKTSGSSGYNGAGGGGGWYGGGCGGAVSNCGGGGSGYVYTSTTASNYPSGCLLNSSYYLTDAETKAGNVSFPSTSGGTETGHEGNGYIKITRIVYKSALPFKMKVNGLIVEASAGYVKVDGIWKQITQVYYKTNNNWNT